jgi:hypothetical protein
MKIFWKNATSDNFSNPADWSTGSVPGPADTAVIAVPGFYTVTADSNPTVLGINTGIGVTLAIPGSPYFPYVFTAAAGTALGANHGTIAVNDLGTLQIGGTFNNPGEITLNLLGNPTILQMTRNTTLSGGGAVVMTDSFGNFIGSPNYNNSTLTNVDNTISGAGSIGGGYDYFTGAYESINLVNEKLGVIDATGINNQL